jgi:hypothetical protein
MVSDLGKAEVLAYAKDGRKGHVNLMNMPEGSENNFELMYSGFPGKRRIS